MTRTRRRARTTGWLLTGALMVAGGLTAVGLRADSAPAMALAARSAPAGTSIDPGAVPDGGLDTVIHTEQAALVSRIPDRAVAEALARRVGADHSLASARVILVDDRAVTADAGRAEAAAAVARGRDASALQEFTAAHRRAIDRVGGDRRQLQTLAVGWYTGGASVSPSSSADLTASQAADAADAELTLLTTLTGTSLRRDTADADTTAAQVAGAGSSLRHATALLATERRVAAHAADAVSGAMRLVAADQSNADVAAAAVRASQRIRAAVVASFDGDEGGGRAPVPSIIGPSALTAPEMSAWFESTGNAVATRATVGQLASWYISEGRAEGVRGDIAFAQAVVETGSFDSPDAVDRNNFAGVGHCDTCSAGLEFPSALAGVRSQIQLLRTYAEAGLTAADLPSPPPLAVLAPQRQYVRGCCRTWNSLTGVWATDGAYGSTILSVYAEMLAFAVAEGWAGLRDG